METPRAQRAAQTRGRLVAVSRELFAAQGYAGTSTEQVLAHAGATRGALYHHFRDKADLFAAVCDALHAEAVAAVSAAVTATTDRGSDAFDALVAGCNAWLSYMASGAARRLLILEGPTILGWERWNELDHRHGFRLLRDGIRAAQDEGCLPDIPTDELAILLNGAMNHAVLTIQGTDPAPDLERRQAALHALLSALRSSAAPPRTPSD